MTTSVDGKADILYFDKEDSFLGKRSVYCPGYAESSGRRHSAYFPNTAYFCPHCGEIWGRAVYDFSFQYAPIPEAIWVTESRRCPSHGDGYLLAGLPASHLAFCSHKLLAREAYLLCLNHKE